MTTNLVGSEVAVVQELERQVRETALDSPIFSAAAQQANSLLASDDCQISLLAGILQWDPSLAARILSLANSALYAPTHAISRLDEAIVLIGLTEIKNVILAASTAKFVGQLSFQQSRVRNRLCYHACLTALLSRQISHAHQLPYRGEEFCAGLLHDIGRLLLASFRPGQFAALEERWTIDPGPETEIERETLGIDHCHLGKIFCEAHGLPKDIAQVVALHHDEVALQGAFPELVVLVSVADHLAGKLQNSSAVEPYELEEDTEFTLRLARVTGSTGLAGFGWLTQAMQVSQRQANTLALLFAGK